MAITKVVPKSWSSMLGIDTAKNPNAINELFLTISVYAAPKIKITNTGKEDMYEFSSAENKVAEYKFYYPKDNIQEDIKHVFVDNTSKLQEIFNDARGTAAAGINLAAQVSSSSTQGALMEEPFIYAKSERRSFSLNLALVAYSDLDADIYDPIRFFRKYSYPRKGRGVGHIHYPHIFRLDGGPFRTNQASDSFYVLEDISISYHDDIKMLKGGHPMQANLTLGFTELVMMYADKFDERPVNVKITETAREKGSGLGGADIPDYQGIEDMTKPSSNAIPKDAEKVGGNILDAAKDTIEDTIKSTRVYNMVSNAKDIIYSEAKTAITEQIKESSLYQKYQTLLESDPRHLDEVRRILRKIRGK